MQLQNRLVSSEVRFSANRSMPVRRTTPNAIRVPTHKWGAGPCC